MLKIIIALLLFASNFVYADSQRKLDDGTIAPGVVVLSQNGQIANSVPLFQQDLIGSAKNFYPDKTRGFVFGKRALIANTLVDLWEGPTAIYVFPTGPMQMQVTSTSAADAAGGTGIQKIHIHYLDGSYRIQTVDVIPNGVTPVLTSVSDILRINGAHATEVGSGGVAAGNISITAVGGAVTYSYITAGFNSARQAIYTVPDGYYGYINHWQASSGSTGNHFCQITVRATAHDGLSHPNVFLVQDEIGSQNGGSEVNFPIPILIPPRTDVKVSAIADAPNAGVTALGAIMGWFEQIQLH